MFILSANLVNYWNAHNTSLSKKHRFLNSLGLACESEKTGALLRFESDCTYFWIKRNSRVKTAPADALIISGNTLIDIKDFHMWEQNQKENNLKQNKDVNRLQKENPEVTGGTLPEGNRVKGGTCKITIGVGHLSNNSIKA